MWFLPRVSALVVLAVIGAALVLLSMDFEVKGIIAIAGGITFVVILFGVVFDLYKGPKR